MAILFLVLTVAQAAVGSSDWYAGDSLALLLAMIALAVYGFYISLAGGRVFSDKLLEAEARG